jgi:hypothetical protein
MIFQIPMGLGKSKCDVPNGTIQGWVCPLNNDYIGSNIITIPYDETIKTLHLFRSSIKVNVPLYVDDFHPYIRITLNQ